VPVRLGHIQVPSGWSFLGLDVLHAKTQRWRNLSWTDPSPASYTDGLIVSTGRLASRTPHVVSEAMNFDEMNHWLARHPELDDVFRQIVDADGGSGGWFQAIPTFGDDEILSSNGPTISVGRSSASILNDLSSRGLLRISRYDRRGDPQFELPADARDFERWRRGLPSPVQQVEREVLQFVNDLGFGDRHPTAAKHLRAAFGLLTGSQLDVVDTTIVGDHLRKALIDVGGAAAAISDPDENLERVFRPRRVAAAERADTAVAMLIDFALALMSLDHSIEHVRDEISEHREPADVDTIRRAAFLTAVCCYELDRTPLALPTEH
jgi:hypothetical protein